MAGICLTLGKRREIERLYNDDMKVVYKGSVYESVIDGNTWSPEEYPAAWECVE